MIVSRERAVADPYPSKHAIATPAPTSTLAGARNSIITFLYGLAPVFKSPRHIATDSKGRLIVSDPQIRTVHVLDPRGKTSFRIEGGPGHRLQLPAGVAVDGEDNIYIADEEKGVVLVYDAYGRFVHYLGLYEDESEFEGPVGIAIDRDAHRLYVVDNPRNMIRVLDLDGKFIASIGNPRDPSQTGKFQHPSEIALSKAGLVVLDQDGNRVQRLDPRGNVVASFPVDASYHPGANCDNGLALDGEATIYVNSTLNSEVRVFSPEGKSLGVFTHPEVFRQTFVQPTGIWIDAANRLYLSDSANRQVEIFQLSSVQPSQE